MRYYLYLPPRISAVLSVLTDPGSVDSKPKLEFIEPCADRRFVAFVRVCWPERVGIISGAVRL